MAKTKKAAAKVEAKVEAAAEIKKAEMNEPEIAPVAEEPKVALTPEIQADAAATVIKAINEALVNGRNHGVRLVATQGVGLGEEIDTAKYKVKIDSFFAGE